MKRILSLLLAALMLTAALAGCNTTPVETPDTTDPASAADTTPAETTPAETEPPVVEKKPYEEAVVAEYDGYTVTLEEPIVVYQGQEGDDAWGHTNFPSVSYTKEGFLRVRWLYGEDKVGAVGNVSYHKISMNGGKSWLPLNSAYSSPAPNMLMTNGKCWGGFVSAGTPTCKELLAQIPDSQKLNLESGHQLILASDLEKYDEAIEKNLTNLRMREYDPETGTYETIECTLNWPYAAVAVFPKDIIYTISGWFGLSGSNVILGSDGTLYTCIYSYGYDAEAETLEEATTDYTKKGKYYTYVFASEDCGRTWDYRAQFYCTEDVEGWEKNECFCEPKMIEMPDGSLFMLMRTGSDNPMYSTVSHDRGYTWSKPEEFNYCGVLPQLLGLDCGVTIATYGRPDLFVTVTNDPTGDTWEEHIPVPLAAKKGSAFQKSCFYTSLLPIDENSAWFAYTDFKYPNKNGVGVKTVILRKITVTFDE